MNHWQTNLGGAIAIVGTSLIGVGVVPELAGANSKTLLWVAVVGFFLSALGKGITALFAADAKTVNNVAAAVDKINAAGPDPEAPPSTTKPPFSPTNENQTPPNA